MESRQSNIFKARNTNRIRAKQILIGQKARKTNLSKEDKNRA
jgi:hypothetical protein